MKAAAYRARSMQSALLNRRGLTVFEIAMLFSVITAISAVMMPTIMRGVRGYVVFKAAQRLDRQFDPKDNSTEHKDASSGSFVETVVVFPMPKSSIYAPEAPLTDIEGVVMGLVDLPKDRSAPGEAAFSQSQMSAWGTSNSNYNYNDVMQ